MYKVFIGQVLAFFRVLISEHILCFMNEQQKLSFILWSINLSHITYPGKRKKQIRKEKAIACMYLLKFSSPLIECLGLGLVLT